VGVVVGVVQVAAPGRAPATHVRAGAVADFDVAAQRGVREPVLGVVVQVGEQPVPVGVLGGDIGDQRRPAGWELPGGAGPGELVESAGGQVQFDDATPAASRRPGTPGAGVGGGVGAVAGGAGEQQVAVVVGDGESPAGAAELPGDEAAGD
jgi:hypothetical protein